MYFYAHLDSIHPVDMHQLAHIYAAVPLKKRLRLTAITTSPQL
jgi:hypothetical protein